MNAARELRRSIENCELRHRAFMQHHDFLSERIQDALAGFAPRTEWLTGPSRVGKTMLINALAREHPATKVAGVRQVPVLVVPIPPNISPVLLPVSVLTALGVPLPQRGITSGVMFNRMADQLKLAQTRVVIFEEASHLVEPGARVPPRAAGDWFKSVTDQLNITLILMGVPRLERLFQSNEQLRLRASARREFRPYDMRIADDRAAFATCVKTYADLFAERGWPIDIPLEVLVKHTYLLSGGLVGVLSRFVQELAAQLVYESPRPLTFEDAALAAQAVESAGRPDSPAFVRIEVTPLEMSGAHAQVLETNGMNMPRNSQKTGRH
ncbi:TniB family NTP-binding protein [Hydrogenophaga sp. OTU3427]|uniref:TniB family NTP-binding protein n=1 Tax=Hydrogenophaga sp. OTU3427 TaxID=3043856 RepID=UPI00313CD7D3